MKTMSLIVCMLVFSLESHTQTGTHGLLLRSHDASFTFFPVMLHRASVSSPFKNGNFEEYWNGRLLYRTVVRKGKLHGPWESWYQDGQRCDSGRIYKNLPDGQWKFWDEQGRLIAIRTFSADKYERLMNEITRSNLHHVHSTLATMYKRNRQEALKLLQAASSFDGVRQPGKSTLSEAVQHNISSGDPYMPVFNRALHHGIFVNYFPGGEVRDSGYYNNGLRDGIWIHVSEKGLTQTGQYKNGRKSGVWKIYDLNGRLMELVSFNKRGEFRHRKFFNKKSRVKTRPDGLDNAME